MSSTTIRTISRRWSVRSLPPPLRPPTTADDDEDDELQFVGRTGQLALVDFPHARENCVTHKFVLGGEKKHCANCYCYVCDDVASKCPKWDDHCKATHTSQAWQARRKAWKGADGAAAAAPAVPIRRYEPRWSCDKLLKAVEVVYPVEESEPPGFNPSVQLRPYQKQSLAFMLAIERSTDATLLGTQAGEGPKLHRKRQRGGLSRRDRRDGVTLDQKYGALLPTKRVRGGWLCDEMGMGKTAVVIASVLANPSTAKPVDDATFQRLLDDIKAKRLTAKDASMAAGQGTPYKTTLIIVNNTLVRQWADEFAKYAPGLSCHTWYGTGNRKDAALQQLRDVDVLITTPHMNFPHELQAAVKFHRIVVDESHLLDAEKAVSTIPSKLEALLRFQTSNLWLVTGTPFTTSLSQLQNQCWLLGQVEFLGTVTGQQYAYPPPTNEEVVSALRKLMVRHTKSQQIRGEVALALPEADCQTVYLDMSADEKLLYELSACSDGTSTLHLSALNDRLRGRREACAHLYSESTTVGPQHRRWIPRVRRS